MTQMQFPFLEPGKLYHIYNRGNNSQAVFHSAFEVNCFLSKWTKIVAPVADLLAYNFLTNHFHLVLQTRESAVHKDTGAITAISVDRLNMAFRRLFIAFAMALHAANGSNGAVFKRRFQRKEIVTTDQFQRVVAYVMFNAQRHGLTNDPMNYGYSSYRFLRIAPPCFLQLDTLYHLFGGKTELELYLLAYQQHYFPPL